MRTGSDAVPAIEFQAVSKRFRLQEEHSLTEFLAAYARGRAWSPPFYALRDVSFEVPAGETIGIIGRNGSGKSTALKLMAGVMRPTEGHVAVRGRVCPIIELGAGFHLELTGRENLFLNASILGMRNREVREIYHDIVGFAELENFMETPVKHFSSGMYLRLGFSIAVHSRPEVLIVDEALAVGDRAFQQKCLAKMHEFQESGVTIVLVSHDPNMVRNFCARAILLDGGHMVMVDDAKAVVDRYLELSSSAAPAATT